MIQIALCLGALLPITGPLTFASDSQGKSAEAQDVNLRYVPKAGERLQHNWTGSHKLLATEVLSIVEGQNPMAVAQLPSLETSERRVTSDWIQAVENGRITKMNRVWTEAELWGRLDFRMPPNPALEVVLKSPLANASTSVVYTYVPEDDNYGVYFDQSAMVEELLGGVRLDHTYESLLPEKGVRAGDTWEVEPQQLIGLLAPTGAMDYRQVQAGGAMLIRTLLMGVGGCTEKVWNPEGFKGHLRCKLEKVVGTGAIAMAHIRLDYKYETQQDRAAAARELQMLGESNRGTIVISNSVHLSGEGKGLLLWDLSLNRAHSFTLIGSEDLEMRVKNQVLNAPAVTQVMKLRGTSEQKYRVAKLTMKGLPETWTKNPLLKLETSATQVGPEPVK